LIHFPDSYKVDKMIKQLFAAALLLSGIAAGAQNVTWQASQPVAPSSAGNSHPRIALAANGNPVVLWGKDANASVNFSRWTGAAFSTPASVSPATMQVFTSSWAGPDIATKGDTVYAIFKAEPEDTAGIYVVTSTNGGATFGTPVRVDNIPGYNSRFPTIATDGAGQPIVGFMKFSSGFTNAKWVTARSMSWGGSFMPEVSASGYNSEPVCDCCPGSVVRNGNTVAMLYRNNWSNKRTIWAGVSNNNGTSYPSGMDVDNTNWMINACPSSGPDGAIVGDTLYTVFMSGSGGTKVYYTKSVLSSMQSNVTVPVTGTSTGISGQNYPRVANDGNTVAIVWVQTENGQPQVGMLLAGNVQQGFPAWQKAVINPNGNSIMNADVAVKDGAIHIVWQDMVSGTVMYQQGTFSTGATGINPVVTEDAFMLSPVPANQVLQISLQNELQKPGVVTITDITGRAVFSQELHSSMRSVSIPTSQLAEGMYQLRLQAADGISTRRFVVAH
jgi:hypothetical protein